MILSSRRLDKVTKAICILTVAANWGSLATLALYTHDVLVYTGLAASLILGTTILYTLQRIETPTHQKRPLAS
ncbi:hypothetical protein [Pyrodictium abyssi]|uniref:Uncharacterized protein n=1 Tax=Pyrodictium abyssi TaxID=54256 RepID=A0ABM8IVA5_9CREN|nr:hypothetical protein PABY_02970 [Pyrodictium abyssi]